MRQRWLDALFSMVGGVCNVRRRVFSFPFGVTGMMLSVAVAPCHLLYYFEMSSYFL